jgi:DNA polymerase III subunit alpha, Gram-positive type
MVWMPSRLKCKKLELRGFEASNVENALFGTLELCNEMLERGFKFGKLDLYRSEASDFISKVIP